MKKFNSFTRNFFAVVAASVLLFSCGEGGKDYRNMLPKDSFLTMSVNPKSLSDKASVGDFTQSVFYKLIDQAMGEDYIEPEQRAYLLSIIAEPSKTGLSTDHDGFLFISMDDVVSSDPVVGVLFKVNDRKAVDKFMEYFIDENGLDRVDQGGMTIIGDVDNTWETTVMVYNDDAFLFYHSEDVYAETRPRIEKLFTQSREESLMGISEASQAFTGNNDLCMLMSFGPMMEYMPNEVKSIPTFSAISKAYFSMPFNFEKGRIASDMKVFFTDKEAEKEYRKLQEMSSPIKGNLAQYIPASSMLSVNANFKGSQVYEYLASIPTYSMVMSMVPQVKTVMDAIDGDLMLSFNTMKMNPMVPVFTAICELNSTSPIEELTPMLAALPIQETGKNQYVFSQGGMTIHFGLKDKMLYITSDSEALAALSGQKIENIGSRYGKLFTTGYSSMVFDFAALRDLLMLGVSQRELGQGAMMAMPILEIFENVVVNTPSLNNTTMEINMTDKSRNAADVIYHTAENMVQMAMSMGAF